MTAPAPWPRSILPAACGSRLNRLLDFAAIAYQELGDGDPLLGVSVKIQDGDGQMTLIIRDGERTRRLSVSDETVERPLLVELESERSEEKVC